VSAQPSLYAIFRSLSLHLLFRFAVLHCAA